MRAGNLWCPLCGLYVTARWWTPGVEGRHMPRRISHHYQQGVLCKMSNQKVNRLRAFGAPMPLQLVQERDRA